MEKRKVCVYDDWDVVETENVMFSMFALWNVYVSLKDVISDINQT